MKVAVFVKATPGSEAGKLPSEQLLADMGKFNQRGDHAIRRRIEAKFARCPRSIQWSKSNRHGWSIC